MPNSVLLAIPTKLLIFSHRPHLSQKISKTAGNADAMNGKHRRSPRYSFVATAEVTEEDSSAVIAARLRHLTGTPNLEVNKNGDRFEAEIDV